MGGQDCSIVGSQIEDNIYAIDPLGNVTVYDLEIENPEDIKVISANENFFGIDFDEKKLYGAPASEFVSMAGDILIS